MTGSPNSRERSSESDQPAPQAVRLAVAGLGWIGRRHASLIAEHSGCQLVGLCDADPVRASALREFDGTGRMKTSVSPLGHTLLPRNLAGFESANATGLPPHELFLAGDIRANEHGVLTIMHTLFVL